MTIRKFRNFFKHRYLGARLYHRWLYRKKIHGAKCVYVVYQMGKVGSSSVSRTLKSALPERSPVFHVHTLSLERIHFNEREYFGANGVRAWFHPVDNRTVHLVQSRFLRSEMSKNVNERRWKFVTLVREPVARNASAFFQIGDILIPGFSERIASGAWDLAFLAQAFLDLFKTHDIPLTWIDEEVRSFLGIDVYEVPFPKEEGYRIFHGDRADLLLLKMERLDAAAGRALSEFLEIEDIHLERANVAGEKAYADTYGAFLKHLTLPAEYLDRMYGSRYSRHFYSASEIQAFRKKWTISGDVR